MPYFLHYYVHVLLEFKVVQSSLCHHVGFFSCLSQKQLKSPWPPETAAVLTTGESPGSPPFSQEALSLVMEDFFISTLETSAAFHKGTREQTLSARPLRPRGLGTKESKPCWASSSHHACPSCIPFSVFRQHPTLCKLQPPPRSSGLQTLSSS